MGFLNKNKKHPGVEENRIMRDTMRMPVFPLYLCEYKLRSLFDQCVFGIVEVVIQESKKSGEKVTPEISTSNVLKLLGVEAKLGGELIKETGISKQVRQTISPIMQLEILLSYFEKSKEMAIELINEDILSTLQPNSLVRFTAEPFIVRLDDKPPSFLLKSQWDDVKRQLQFEIEFERQPHLAWVSKLYNQIVIATISTSNITPHGFRGPGIPTIYNAQNVLARFIGHRLGVLFMDLICTWAERPNKFR